MALEEGQIYEGAISLSGGEDVPRKWIVVAPFGKQHVHSIDNPLEVHCWPAPLIERGVEEGRVSLVTCDPEHPIIKLQRDKEALEIHDSHLGLNDTTVNRMLDYLHLATEQGMETAPYAAGEILAFLDRSNFDEEDRNEIEFMVNEYMNRFQAQ